MLVWCVSLHCMADNPSEDAVATLKQCTKGKSHRQCKQWFTQADKCKFCPKCRAKARESNKSNKAKETKKRYATSDKGQASIKRYNESAAFKTSQKTYRTSDKGKASEKLYATSDKGKATINRNAAKYRKSEKGTAYRHEYEKREKRLIYKSEFWTSAKGKAYSKKRYVEFGVWLRLTSSLHSMVTGTHPHPVTFPNMGIFEDNSAAQAHFESTFDTWMNWKNQGKLHKDTLRNTIWQIGHRIPKIWYRHDDVDESNKAWSRTNLFAQCAVENIKAGDRNILSKAQWIALKSIWPKQCDGMTDEQAWMWADNNVDNATRVAERVAAVDAYESEALPFTDRSDNEFD